MGYKIKHINPWFGEPSMCGIVAIINRTNNKEPVAPYIKEALLKLEYRGYDSVGIATISGGRLFIKKDVGKINEVDKKINLDDLPGFIGIGHTRWATHGKPSKKNAHPHTDCKNNLAIVHNGIIENFLSLRLELSKKGHTFKSETDSEIIAHLVEDFLNEGYDLNTAFKKTISRLKGSYAIALTYTKQPDIILCAKKDSPLVIGISNKRYYCTSDIPAFLKYTNDVLILYDGDIATVSREGIIIENTFIRDKVNRDVIKVSWTEEMAKKGGYPHFYIKEVHEQPITIKDTINNPPKNFDKILEYILNADDVLFVAAGTSYHAGIVGQYMLSLLGLKFPRAIISSEYETLVGRHVDKNTLLIAISQSGETADTIKAIKSAKKYKAKVLGIINVVGSSIARLSDVVYYTHAGPEISVAATKTYTTQIAALAKIIFELYKEKNEKEANNLLSTLHTIPNLLKTVINAQEQYIQKISREYLTKTNFFYLSRGINVATAMEGSLKLKEIAYVHSEAYPAGESKHGPIALIESGFPIIFIAPQDNTYSHIIGNIMEMRARGAHILSVIDENDDKIASLSDFAIKMPKIPSILSPLIYVVPLQLFAYYIAVGRGCPIDKPRNLAKSVTVL